MKQPQSRGIPAAVAPLGWCQLLLLSSLVASVASFQPLSRSRAQLHPVTFHSSTTTTTTTTPIYNPASSTLAAKKRRRRKGAKKNNPSVDDNELPDFDLPPLEDDSVVEPPTAPAAAAPVKATTTTLSDPDKITPAMMGSSSKAGKSVKELLADRSLEQKFEFEATEESEALPDLADLMRQSRRSTTAGSADNLPAAGQGKKKARQAARRAAAIAAEEAAAEEEASIFKSIPFLLDDKGEVAPNKIAEAGAWLGIGLLLSWEIYINSPFFERVAPMAPIVY